MSTKRNLAAGVAAVGLAFGLPGGGSSSAGIGTGPVLPSGAECSVPQFDEAVWEG